MIISFKDWVKSENLDLGEYLEKPEGTPAILERGARTVATYPDNYPRACGGQGDSDTDDDVTLPPAAHTAVSSRGFVHRSKKSK